MVTYIYLASQSQDYVFVYIYKVDLRDLEKKRKTNVMVYGIKENMGVERGLCIYSIKRQLQRPFDL